jgi:hypothetical protein
VVECQNANGSTYACALSDTGPFAVTVTKPGIAPSGNDRAQVPGQYPTGASPITGNGTGSTGAVVGTLAAVLAKKTWICGFNVLATGSGAVGPITIAGLVGSSMVFQGSAPGTVASITFTPCIPASATNTAITVTTTADASASAVDVNSWGFQQ